jgi:hypothetical protein
MKGDVVFARCNDDATKTAGEQRRLILAQGHFPPLQDPIELHPEHETVHLEVTNQSSN